MKKLISIITILTLIMCMSATVSMAADDRGADAHSPSMSAESGEEPIADQSTTEEGGGDVIDEEPEQVIPDEPQEEDVPAAIEDEEADPGFTFNSRPIIFIAIGAVVLIAVVVAVAKKSSRKKKNDYRAKH